MEDGQQAARQSLLIPMPHEQPQGAADLPQVSDVVGGGKDGRLGCHAGQVIADVLQAVHRHQAQALRIVHHTLPQGRAAVQPQLLQHGWQVLPGRGRQGAEQRAVE